MTDESAYMRLAGELGEVKGVIKTLITMKEQEVTDTQISRRDINQGIMDLKVGIAGVMRDIAHTTQGVADLVPQVDNLAVDVSRVSRDVADMKPKVDKLKTVYDQGTGAVWALNGIRILALAGAGFVGWMLSHLIPLLGRSGFVPLQ